MNVLGTYFVLGNWKFRWWPGNNTCSRIFNAGEVQRGSDCMVENSRERAQSSPSYGHLRGALIVEACEALLFT
jgi:hypothetical protein